MFREIFTKFDRYLQGEGPVLVGLSGGPDSVFLLWALYQWSLSHPISIRVVHIDHGWREESAKQAIWLKQEIQRRFSLDMEIIQASCLQMGMANLEEKSRQFRLDVFEKIYGKAKAQALLLGHHADDQAELVLKRCLEGSSLLGVSGMAFCHQMGLMKVIRPLLEVSKVDIIQALDREGMAYLIDPTNEDPRFLRGRMRVSLFNDLEKGLGKKIRQPLNELAKEARLWKDFIDKELQPYLSRVSYHSVGANLPWEALPDHPALLGYFFKKVGGQFHLTLTRPFIEQLLRLTKAKPGKKCSFGQWDWIAGYRSIYLIKRDIDFFESTLDEIDEEDSAIIFAKWVPLEGELKIPCKTMRVSEKLFLVEWFRKNHLPLEWAMRFPVYQEKSTGYVIDFLTKQKEINFVYKKRVVISYDSRVINKIK